MQIKAEAELEPLFSSAFRGIAASSISEFQGALRETTDGTSEQRDRMRQAIESLMRTLARALIRLE